MAKIEAPNRGYNGPGPGGVMFKDGVANTDDEAALNYYRSAGYTVDGDGPEAGDSPEPPDPRDVNTELVGTALRDAAVDPEESDFLPPTNAGQDNPHGSTVVAPQIHASGPKGIRPGETFVEDTDKQAARETEFAKARLVDQATAAEANRAEVPDADQRGELDLSDPGSVQAGKQAAEESSESGVPAKSASKPEWVDYAVAQGADRDEADGLTKAELQERYA